MSNLERLLREAIAQTERHSREWDEIFNWNFEPKFEGPYDTLSNANEHVDDVEAIECNAYYSNDYVAGSSNIVFQDDSDDEMDEEEAEFTNFPHEVSQVVLQDTHSFEPKVTENSDSEDSNYSESDFEEESMEEEVEEILVMPDLVAAELPAASSIVEEHEPNISYPDSYGAASFTKDAIIGYDPDIKELQELLGFSDHELDELVEKGIENDQILDAELDNLYRDSSNQVCLEIVGDKSDGAKNDRLYRDNVSSLFKRDCKLSMVDNLVLTMPLIARPCTDLEFDPLSSKCEHDFVLTKEPKPPDEFLVESVFGGGIRESNIVHGQLNELFEVDRLAMLKRGIECVHLNYFEEPPNCFCILVKGFSEDVGITSHSYLKVALIKITIKPLKEWNVYIHVISFSWRMFYRNDKTEEDILLCEYDEKGGGYVMLYWP